MWDETEGHGGSEGQRSKGRREKKKELDRKSE